MRDQPEHPILAGAELERLARAARAAQQLCDVLWESLHEELRQPQAEHVRALSERLVEVSSTVALLAGTTPLSDVSAPVAPNNGARVPGSGSSSTHAPLSGSNPGGSTLGGSNLGEPSSQRSAAPRATATNFGAGQATPSSPPPAGESDRAPLVERRTPPAASPRTPPAPTPPPAALQSIPAQDTQYTFTKLVDERAQADSSQPLASVAPIQPEIEIRDVRREEGPSAWVSSVGRLLARHAEDGLPFAVLLVEIVDVAHLERSETPHDLHGIVAQVESALGRGMRASDRLSRETLGRYWLVAPETNGTGARMLAERLARLVRTSAAHRGVPMEVAIGIAVCPEDGIEAPALAARADLGVYSARATGRSIAHTDRPPPAS